MPDLLRDSSTWLDQQRRAHLASEVTYRRGAQVWTVPATRGNTRYEVEDVSGLRVGGQVIDFLILAADLDVEPEPGDVIVTDGRRYEVAAHGQDVKGWRWSDLYRQSYRIHTKDIGAES